MNPNEVIGKKAVEWGLLDCWHEQLETKDKSTYARFGGMPFGGTLVCKHCGASMPWINKPLPNGNPDYSIYENIAPVLDKLREIHGVVWAKMPHYADGKSFDRLTMFRVDSDTIHRMNTQSSTDLPTTLRDMVAELISKGEV